MRILLVGLLAFLSACAASTTARLGLPELRTVAHVDLERYMGSWHEIASFPHSFQKGCTGTTATYSLTSSGEVEVVNRCFKPDLDGEEDSAAGLARVVDSSSNAKLEVSFFRPFWGDYWIIDLGADYEYAVVGHPGRDYLWILSRQPVMDEPVYSAILGRLRQQGYEVDRLKRTLQRAVK